MGGGHQACILELWSVLGVGAATAEAAELLIGRGGVELGMPGPPRGFLKPWSLGVVSCPSGCGNGAG